MHRLRIVAFIGLLLPSIGAARPRRAEEVRETPRWLVPTLHNASLLLVMRYTCSLRWPETYNIQRVGRNWDTFKRSWSKPPVFDTGERFFEWDHDPWSINLIGHGLMGSELYLSHRRAHHSWWISTAVAVGWSIVWEYLVEGWHKRPSGIDLLWSPLGGALIGEGRYRLYRLLQTMQPSVGRQLLFYLVDPIGQLERDLFDLPY